MSSALILYPPTFKMSALSSKAFFREAREYGLSEPDVDRLRDVLDGPGLGVVERGELFHQPRIVELVIAARDARTAPS